MRHLLIISSVVMFIACGAFGGKLPNCSVISGKPGGPAIVINGKAFSPVMFMANNQFGRDDVLIDEVKMAAEAGVNLIGFNIPLDWHGTAEKAAAIIDQFCRANPNAYYYARVWLGPNAEWVKSHPEECITKYSPTPQDAATVKRLNLASPSSRAWREETAKMLRGRVTQIIQGPHADHFLGVEIEYLQTGEWFYPDTNDFMDYSPANLRAFRKWLRGEYGTDRKLQQAWNNATVTIDTAAFPTPEMREAAGWGPFRDVVAQRPAIDMERFQNELVAGTIAYFASVVKTATARRSLVGAYYGYTMELNDNGPRALVQSGHLALGKLLESKDVDMIHAPFSYFERGLGQPGHLHAPVDSVALHGKLHVCEEDAFTHLAQAPAKDLIAPGWNERTKTSNETCAIAARDFGNAITHRAGMWFFDLLSDGRWRDSAVWQTVGILRRVAAHTRGEPPFQPKVAFVVDEHSPEYLKASTYPILIQSLSWWRSELDRIGTPVGYYLQSDLARLPDSVRVVILADAFHLEKDERRAIKNLLDHGNTVLFNYAPDIVGPEGVDVARIQAITGVDIEAKADSVPMTIVCELSHDEIAIDAESWRPRFVIPKTKGDVVARYKATGEISAAAVPLGRGISIYTATPRLPARCLQKICRRAGVYLYRSSPGMTGVAGPYLFIHTDAGGPVELAWPGPFRSVARLFPATPDLISIGRGNVWSDRLPAGTTAIFSVNK